MPVNREIRREQAVFLTSSRRDIVNPCSHYGMLPVFWGDPGASISSLLSARWAGRKLEMVLSFLIQSATVAGLQTI